MTACQDDIFEDIPTGDFEFDTLKQKDINVLTMAGCKYKFIDFDQMEDRSCLEKLGPNSVLGDAYGDLDDILLYAHIMNVTGLGVVYILEKGRDFIIFSKVPTDETQTVLYGLYRLAMEHQDAQVYFEDFKEDHYARHSDTGLNIMANKYANVRYNYEFTEFVPMDEFSD